MENLFIRCILLLGLMACLSANLVAAPPSQSYVEQKLKGKSSSEVQKIMRGPPREKKERLGSSLATWRYSFNTVDDSGKRSSTVGIIFLNKRVSGVFFE